MNVEKELREIRRRNRSVELDKAWETSWTRRILLAVLTYLVMVVFFLSTGLPRPWINSIVPAAAFVLSTLTLPLFKGFWIRAKRRRRSSRP